MAGGVLDNIFTQAVPEEATLLGALFETRRVARLKMTTEIDPSLVFPMSVLGVIAVKFRSKTLKAFSMEFFQLMISKDRQGRDELIEALTAVRRSASEEE